MEISDLKKASFAAGCFWGVEDIFSKTKGVTATAVGYEGGALTNPAYENVCSGTTGHAETVELTYNPQEVSYEELLHTFFDLHDPTTRNRQGPDVGSQYRSVIFYHTLEQKAAAEKAKMTLEKSGKYASPVVTEIIPASTFWRAEEYHQKYFEKHGGGTCHS